MTKDNPHQNVLVDLSDDIDSACRTLSKHPQGLALFSEVIDMLRLHEKRLDAFLAEPLLEYDPIYLEEGTGSRSRLAYAKLLQTATTKGE